MRAFGHHTGLALLVGALSVGCVGTAMAGADDGGTHAFFAIPSPGSATGMGDGTSPGPAPGAADAAAQAQPNASVSRTGVAQERAVRPHVAVTRIARDGAPSRHHAPHVAVARHEGGRRTLEAHRTEPRRILHAMHRGPEGEGHQS